MPAKRIIILEKTSDTPLIFRYALWADVPAARQSFYASPGAVSAWKDASGAENTAIATGAVAEKIDTVQVTPGTGIAVIELQLQDSWTNYQNLITNTNPWVRYGSLWDGTTWTLTGVA